MKKVLFTSILLLSAVSFGGNIYAQDATGGNDTGVTTSSESSASVEFKASEDGKTLTISGQGDLTTLKTISQSLKFTTSGTKNVGTSNNIYNISPVGTSAVYSAAKTYYGRYFPNKQNNIKPRIFIYPYANEYGDLLHYFNILDTAIHEFIHHLQYTDPNFKRKKGVMHDTQFWKLYNHYTNRAEKYNIIDMEVVNNDI